MSLYLPSQFPMLTGDLPNRRTITRGLLYFPGMVQKFRPNPRSLLEEWGKKYSIQLDWLVFTAVEWLMEAQ